MVKKLWELCREEKDHKRLTNQSVADASGISLNAVSQYLRGETKNASVYTVGPICKAIGVSMDDYFGIARDDESTDERQQMKMEYMEKTLRTYTRLVYLLGVIVLMAMIALILDLANPNIGWFRAPINAMLPLIMYF